MRRRFAAAKRASDAARALAQIHRTSYFQASFGVHWHVRLGTNVTIHLNVTRRTFRRSSMLRDDCRPAIVLVSNINGPMSEGKQTIAPPRNRLRMASTTSIDDHHANESGTAAVNKYNSLITVKNTIK